MSLEEIVVTKPSVCNGFVPSCAYWHSHCPYEDWFPLTGVQLMMKPLIVAGAVLLGGIETLATLTLICRS